jgi:hypothetical protein
MLEMLSLTFGSFLLVIFFIHDVAVVLIQMVGNHGD